MPSQKSEPSRIGIDARLLAYRHGGIAEYTRQLIAALAEIDRVTRYAILHSARDKNAHIPAENFRHIRILIPPHHRMEKAALALELLPRRLDLLHTPDFIPPYRVARRHVITIHDLHFLRYPHFQTADSLRYYRDQIQSAVRRANHILAQTETTRREIIDLLAVPAEKITVHSLGVHSSFRVLLPAEIKNQLAPYALPPDFLLFVGTIEPRKNIPGLLAAYSTLVASNPATPPLVLAGQQGWLADESFQAIEKYHLQERVIWLENVPAAVLPALYNRARLLVLPSFYEGFGLPAIEAMACGTPVVVTERGALPEVVGAYGVYINPEDSDSIAAGIRQVLDDEELRAHLKQNGLNHSRQYTWQRTAQITLEVYRKLIQP